MVAFYIWEYRLAIKQSPVYTEKVYWVINSHPFILHKNDLLYFATISYQKNFLRYKKWPFISRQDLSNIKSRHLVPDIIALW